MRLVQPFQLKSLKSVRSKGCSAMIVTSACWVGPSHFRRLDDYQSRWRNGCLLSELTGTGECNEGAGAGSTRGHKRPASEVHQFKPSLPRKVDRSSARVLTGPTRALRSASLTLS